jgi:hypothetical protein
VELEKEATATKNAADERRLRALVAIVKKNG